MRDFSSASAMTATQTDEIFSPVFFSRPDSNRLRPRSAHAPAAPQQNKSSILLLKSHLAELLTCARVFRWFFVCLFFRRLLVLPAPLHCSIPRELPSENLGLRPAAAAASIQPPPPLCRSVSSQALVCRGGRIVPEAEVASWVITVLSKCPAPPRHRLATGPVLGTTLQRAAYWRAPSSLKV